MNRLIFIYVFLCVQYVVSMDTHQFLSENGFLFTLGTIENNASECCRLFDCNLQSVEEISSQRSVHVDMQLHDFETIGGEEHSVISSLPCKLVLLEGASIALTVHIIPDVQYKIGKIVAYLTAYEKIVHRSFIDTLVFDDFPNHAYVIDIVFDNSIRNSTVALSRRQDI